MITGLREVPNDGLDYGLLRYVGRVPELAAEPQIQFSYLGRLDLGGAADRPWSLLTERYLDARLIDPEPDLPLPFAVHISSLAPPPPTTRSRSPTRDGAMPCSRPPNSTP